MSATLIRHQHATATGAASSGRSCFGGGLNSLQSGYQQNRVLVLVPNRRVFVVPARPAPGRRRPGESGASAGRLLEDRCSPPAFRDRCPTSGWSWFVGGRSPPDCAGLLAARSRMGGRVCVCWGLSWLPEPPGFLVGGGQRAAFNCLRWATISWILVLSRIYGMFLMSNPPRPCMM